jgi:ankyrin repeat protein
MPLHIAISRGDFGMVKRSIDDQQADVNAKDTLGRTSLHIAILYINNLEMVKYFAEKYKATVNAQAN